MPLVTSTETAVSVENRTSAASFALMEVLIPASSVWLGRQANASVTSKRKPDTAAARFQRRFFIDLTPLQRAKEQSLCLRADALHDELRAAVQVRVLRGQGEAAGQRSEVDAEEAAAKRRVVLRVVAADAPGAAGHRMGSKPGGKTGLG